MIFCALVYICASDIAATSQEMIISCGMSFAERYHGMDLHAPYTPQHK